MSESTDTGNDFERQVANLYRMLGYDVRANIDLDGFQTDLIATKRIPGADETKLIVECKFKSTGTVSNEELSKLSNTFTEAARPEGYHKAVMVTNTGFSSKAGAFARQRGYLVLKTLKDLEEETLDLFTAYGRLRREYQSTAIHTLYVPCGGEGRLPGTNHTAKFDNLDSTLRHWIEKGPAGFLTIMADFGAGKTTLLERLRFYYADRYERSDCRIKPLLFRAKDLHKFASLTDYAISTVASQFRATTEPALLWRMIEAGEFLILIDGFDEVAQHVDAVTRRHYFAVLSGLFNTQAHSFMTCRPTFFLSSSEYDTVIDEVLLEDDQTLRSVVSDRNELQIDRSRHLQRLAHDLSRGSDRRRNLQRIRNIHVGQIQLLPFSSEQIDAYLELRDKELRDAVGLDAKAVQRFLHGVYDIRDLMARPILLDMIVRTVLLREIDVKQTVQKIGAAEIYEAYIRALLKREFDDRETRRLLPPATRQALIEWVAVALYKRNAGDICFAEVVDVLREYDISELQRQLPAPLESETVASDIVLTGFLTRDDDGRFRFLHKSFLEFLVARHLARVIISGKPSDIGDTEIPEDIIYFFGSLLLNDHGLREATARQLRQSTDQQWTANLARSLISSGVELNDFTLTGVTLEKSSKQQLHWTAADLKDICFNMPHMVSMRFDDCNLENVSFRSNIDEFAVTECAHCECLLSGEIGLSHFRSANGRLDISGRAKSLVVQNCSLELKLTGIVSCLDCVGGTLSVGTSEAGTIATLQIKDCDRCTLDNISFAEVSVVASTLILRKLGNHLPLSAYVTALHNGTLISYDLTRTIGLPAMRARDASDVGVSDSTIFGVTIEGRFAAARYWPGCRGVILYSDHRSLSSALLWRVDGHIVFMDQRLFTHPTHETTEVTSYLLKRACRTLGKDIAEWHEAVESELRWRASEIKR